MKIAKPIFKRHVGCAKLRGADACCCGFGDQLVHFGCCVASGDIGMFDSRERRSAKRRIYDVEGFEARQGLKVFLLKGGT